MFIVVDGLDGIGKGAIVNEIAEFFKNKRILDLHDYWVINNDHPDFVLGNNNMNHVPLDSFDIILSSEPTYVGIGSVVRDEITAENAREYSAYFTASQFSADREVLYKRVHIPALTAGKTIVQSRCVASSIVYQTMQGDDGSVSIDDILDFSGNKLALQYSPDLLIIPTINNPEELMKRLELRHKKDNSVFEKLEFQLKLKPFYESDFLRDVFESRSTKVMYLDASVSENYTREQARNIVNGFIEYYGK
ncbi:MAG: dTMP kinase [Candidatus Woesearchaeota archaeon]